MLAVSPEACAKIRAIIKEDDSVCIGGPGPSMGKVIRRDVRLLTCEKKAHAGQNARRVTQSNEPELTWSMQATLTI